MLVCGFPSSRLFVTFPCGVGPGGLAVVLWFLSLKRATGFPATFFLFSIYNMVCDGRRANGRGIVRLRLFSVRLPVLRQPLLLPVLRQPLLLPVLRQLLLLQFLRRVLLRFRGHLPRLQTLLEGF